MAKFGSIKETQNVVEGVKKADLSYLKTVVPETLLNLDQALNYRFVIEPTFVQILKEIRDGLDFKKKHIKVLEEKLNNPTATSGLPLGLNRQIANYENLIDNTTSGLKKKISDLEGDKSVQNSKLTSSNKDEVNSAKNALAAIQGQIDAKNREITTLESKIQALKTSAQEVEQKKKELEDFRATYKDVIGQGTTPTLGIRKRLQDIVDTAEKFDFNKLIDRKIYSLGEPTAKAETPLDTIFIATPPKNPVAYTLCDNQQGNPLLTEGGGVKVTTDGGQTVTLSGVKIVNDKLVIEKIKIDPTTGITFPINLRLAIRGRTQDQDTGVNLDHFKNLDFTINASNFDQAARRQEVKKYNSTGAGNVIQNAMTASHANNIRKIEKEMFFKAVAQGDGPKLEKLTEKQKDDLYESVRLMYRDTSGGAPAWEARLNTMDNFNTGAESFTKWMSADEHDSNKPEFTKDAAAYRDYIHNNLEDQIKKYFEQRFNNVFGKDKDANTFLKAQVTNYLTDIETQKQDSNIDHDINTVLERDAYKMRNRKRFGFFGRRDVNYLRFFAGSDSRISLKDQTVNIVTNENIEPIKYNMDLEVTGKQGILATIKIGAFKEMKLKAGDPTALVRGILGNQDIPEGKTRAHIAYNVVKGMIDMAAKKDISLSYRNASNHNMVIKLDGKNIVLEDQDDMSTYGNTNRRQTTTIFDYSRFENTNVFDAGINNDNRSLRTGIESLMGHFTCAMNNVHEQYRHATEKRLWGLRNSNTTADFPTSFWLSPIKKLCNVRRNMKFDFSTNATANGKTVNIEFKNNTFILQTEGLKKPISGRDLGSLLGHRVGGIRIFDGIERDICKSVYQNMIEKLRTNTKIARTNFGVRDPMTGRVYILDEDGQFGYVRAEAAQGTNTPIRKRNAGNILKKSAITGGLLAGGFFTGGVSALATPLSRGGAATAGLRGAGATNAAGLGTYLGTNRGREFGVVAHPPAGRIMCNESETKELLKNPFLMGRLIKAMNDKL